MIDELLANALEECMNLRKFGATAQADAVVALVGELKTDPAFRAYLTWHDETGARKMSGRSTDWFRLRFAYFEKQGLAKREGRNRYYRETLVRAVGASAAIEAAQHEGERAAREDQAA